jgi:uncharacterized phage protein gp47/JayE
MTVRNKANKIQLPNEVVIIYATPRISDALKDVMKDLTLYQGVKLSQLFEAVYNQGKKDGARVAFEAISEKVCEAQKAVPHKNPGKPKKKKQ